MAGTKKRFMKLAGMTASITGKVAKNSLKQLSTNEEKRAKARTQMMKDVGLQIADTLGEMKGAVMKVGQIASQYREFFPEEVSQALEKLQNNAPPMPFDVIKKQVETELGKPISEAFYSFEETPFASASIGQVHKAVLFADQDSTDESNNTDGETHQHEKTAGQEVVVKVQYPNIEENIDSDLKQVRLALKLVGVMNMSKELQKQLFEEISKSLHQELDYIQEAKNIVTFYDFYADDAGIIIPQVINTHSTKRILTLSTELGESLETAKTWSNDIKQKIATHLFHFSAGQLVKLKLLHCDPHPGNFAFRQDGSLIAYDFGGVRSYTEEEVDHFKKILNYALKGDIPALEKGLIEIGTRKDDDIEIDPDFYHNWLSICLKPLSIKPHYDGEFDFGNSGIHYEVVANAKSSLKHFNQFQPSTTTMMLDRTVSGQYWNLVSLGVTIDLSELLTEYID